jgi:Cof subfamily protein (haloacid dehalogenase superfamily)
MPRPKLIAIDIDGTLVNSKVELDQSVVDTIFRARDEGALITLATGRMVSAASEFIDRLEIDLPLVALNGAFVGWRRNCRAPIFHAPIHAESSIAVTRASWETDCTIIHVNCDSALGRNLNELTAPALNSWIVNISPLEDIESLAQMESSTILIAGDEAQITALNRKAAELLDGNALHYFFPSIRYFPMHYLEIRAKGTSKGDGLMKLAKHLGIMPSEVLAIGDYINDIEMAQMAGSFGAPANARPEIIEIADYISPFTNDEGAVSDIIEKMFFGVD